MNGPQHYAEAERLQAQALSVMERAAAMGATTADGMRLGAHLVAQAQVHATLATAAALTHLAGGLPA